jgi:hypothetical protein
MVSRFRHAAMGRSAQLGFTAWPTSAAAHWLSPNTFNPPRRQCRGPQWAQVPDALRQQYSMKERVLIGAGPVRASLPASTDRSRSPIERPVSDAPAAVELRTRRRPARPSFFQNGRPPPPFGCAPSREPGIGSVCTKRAPLRHANADTCGSSQSFSHTSPDRRCGRPPASQLSACSPPSSGRRSSSSTRTLRPRWRCSSRP